MDQAVKKSACSAGDLDLIPGSGRYHGVGHGNPLQYSCLQNSVDRGAWWATVHGVAKSQTQLSDLTLLLSFHSSSFRCIIVTVDAIVVVVTYQVLRTYYKSDT